MIETLPRVAALAAVAALAVSGATQAAGENSVALQVKISNNATVYLMAQTDGVRAAMSADAVAAAQPAKFGKEFTLPIPKEQLPDGVTAVKATMTFDDGKSHKSITSSTLQCTLTTCRTDDHKAEWQYAQRVYANSGPTVTAKTVTLPDPAKMELVVWAGRPPAEDSNQNLHVYVAPKSGSVLLTALRKDGRDAQVKLCITNSAGAPVATKTGSLYDFGNDRAGPRYYVKAAKGNYTCVATVDMGDGQALKGETTVSFP